MMVVDHPYFQVTGDDGVYVLANVPAGVDLELRAWHESKCSFSDSDGEWKKGRKLVEEEIFSAAADKVGVFGIELLDIRFKRINYNESVRPKIYDRMISERRQIAERFLAEGKGEAARIRGNRVRDLDKIQSEAYRKVEEIRGVADARASEIYAAAYNRSPAAARFYEFTRTMQAYGDLIDDETTLVLSTDSDIFRYLKGLDDALGASNGSADR